MAELKPKKTETAPPPPPPNEQISVAETLPVPQEFRSIKDGIVVTVEGDFVRMRLSQYVAEHIGAFRSCDYVHILFKNGQTPDITATSEQKR